MNNFKIKTNNFFSLGLALATGGLFFLSLQFVAAQDIQGQPKPTEVLVKIKDTERVEKFLFSPELDASLMANGLAEHESVEYAEPNYEFNLAAFPNDPLFGRQSYLQQIKIGPAWSKELIAKESRATNPEVTIAIIDSGTDIDHPDLIVNIWENTDEISGDGIDNDSNGYIDDFNGWDFIEGSPDPNPKFGSFFTSEAMSHGTVVAGLAAASGNNKIGIAGVSWRTKIMPLRALDGQGRGNVLAAVRAIDYAIANGADVINMSFVGNEFSRTFADAIRRAYEANVVMVAASGNANSQNVGTDLDVTPAYPVCYDLDGQNMIIGVASLSSANTRSSFSNYGSDCIDISAPGEGFIAPVFYEPSRSGFTEEYGSGWSGTSVSAPLVSGVAAIVRSLNLELGNSQVRDLLLNSTDSVEASNPNFSGKLGTGIVNAERTITTTLSGVTNTPGKPKAGVPQDHLLTGLGFGEFPHIKISKLNGEPVRSFLSYAESFGGSVRVAAGDVDGDGHDEIITGAGPGGGPHIRIFDTLGNLENQFFAYETSLRSGVYVATGDLNGNGRDEIIVGADKGGLPRLRVFDKNGIVLAEFLAYGSNFPGGVRVAAGDIDSDGIKEIITGAGPGGGPHIRIFNLAGELKGQFFAYNENSSGGTFVTAGDVKGDGRDEVIVGVGFGGLPTVRVFGRDWKRLSEFFAYEPQYTGGVIVEAGDVDGDGFAEVVTGRISGTAEVNIFNRLGLRTITLQIRNGDWQGGVRPSFIGL